MIAYCGLVCDQCPIHLATIEKDKPRQKTMRESIAEECAINYGLNLQAEDINDCDGCTSVTGRVFAGCVDCGIRKCVIAKEISSCAFCEDYMCTKLKELYSFDHGAQHRLEDIRNRNMN